MPKETDPKTKHSREAFLEALRRGEKPSSESQNEITHQALLGMQYLNPDTNLEQFLGKLDQKIDQKTKRTTKVISFWQTPALKIAATALLLLIPGYYLYQSSFSTPDYTAAYFEHLPTAIPGTSIQKGGQESIDQEKRALYKEYNQKSYREAIPKLRAYLAAHPMDDQARFYYGIALLGNQEAAAAKIAFEKVLAGSPTPAYQENAQWYLALSLVKAEAFDEAKKVLSAIRQEKGAYTQKASELLSEIGQ